MSTCIAAGGTITGEHGVGIDKLRYMPLIFDPESLVQCWRCGGCSIRENG